MMGCKQQQADRYLGGGESGFYAPLPPRPNRPGRWACTGRDDAQFLPPKPAQGRRPRGICRGKLFPAGDYAPVLCPGEEGHVVQEQHQA